MTQPEPAQSDDAIELREVDPASYRLHGEVARGGVGSIKAAYDVRLRHEVALKMLHDPSVNQTRFVREALLTARLQHPSIIPVHEVGRFPTGEPFIAMKRVRAGSLREAIRARATLEERLQLLPNVLSVSEAMAYAHSQRVIHRDLKPSNVLLGAFGETVVIDWGLAKHLDEQDPISRDDKPAAPVDATRTGAVLGTPAYMSPEQACGDEVDARADVFSLGAILYEVIVGTPPFDGSSAEEVLAQARRRALVPVGERRADVPHDLVAIVTRAMAPLDERYRDAGELADDLRRYQLGDVLEPRRAVDDFDPAVEAQFRAELRRRIVKPLRITCGIIASFVPLFGVVRYLISGAMAAGEIRPRSLVVAIAVAIIAASYSERGRGYADVLAMFSIALVAALICGLYLRNPADEFAGSTASMVLVLLGCSTMYHLPPKRMAFLLSTVSALFLLTSYLVEAHPSRPRLMVQATLFSGSTLVAIIGLRFHFRVLRSEFYSRYRLEDANRRLAELDRRRNG